MAVHATTPALIQHSNHTNAPYYEVMAWDIGDTYPRVVKDQCTTLSKAKALAKEELMYGTARYTAVKDSRLAAPFYEKIYTLKYGLLVEDEVE